MVLTFATTSAELDSSVGILFLTLARFREIQVHRDQSGLLISVLISCAHYEERSTELKWQSWRARGVRRGRSGRPRWRTALRAGARAAGGADELVGTRRERLPGACPLPAPSQPRVMAEFLVTEQNMFAQRFEKLFYNN